MIYEAQPTMVISLIDEGDLNRYIPQGSCRIKTRKTGAGDDAYAS